jgi:hypothetical protein
MQTAVKERPILFSAPMVRAILAGQKTQTRRIVNPRYSWEVDDSEGVNKVYYPCYVTGEPEPMEVPCPYGDVGERLWVRETHYVERAGYQDGTDRFILYKATDDHAPVSKWTPSIHMPRFASRINLEIVEVAVQRVREISREDAIAEGIFLNDNDWWDAGNGLRGELSPEAAFRELWASINGSESWTNNPWVWVIKFKKLSP